MTFVLREIKTGDTFVFGLEGSCTLGRSRINNILLKDHSCSHRHARITVIDTTVSIEDLGSKNGTYVNKQKLVDKKTLENGDSILFGHNDCTYKFIKLKLETVFDESISEDERLASKQTFEKLGVSLVENYSKECTHYTTELISLDTLKKGHLLECLIDVKPIVTIKFWNDLLQNSQESLEMPNFYKYCPKICEELIFKEVEEIFLNKKRSILFKDVVCFFLEDTSQSKLKQIIMKCGGVAIVHNGEANFAMSIENQISFFNNILIITNIDEIKTLTEKFFLDKMRQLYTHVEIYAPDDIYKTIFNGYWLNKERNEASVLNESVLTSNAIIQETSRVPSHNYKNSRSGRKSQPYLNNWITVRKNVALISSTPSIERNKEVLQTNGSCSINTSQNSSSLNSCKTIEHRQPSDTTEIIMLDNDDLNSNKSCSDFDSSDDSLRLDDEDILRESENGGSCFESPKIISRTRAHVIKPYPQKKHKSLKINPFSQTNVESEYSDSQIEHLKDIYKDVEIVAL